MEAQNESLECCTECLVFAEISFPTSGTIFCCSSHCNVVAIGLAGRVMLMPLLQGRHKLSYTTSTQYRTGEANQYAASVLQFKQW